MISTYCCQSGMAYILVDQYTLLSSSNDVPDWSILNATVKRWYIVWLIHMITGLACIDEACIIADLPRPCAGCRVPLAHQNIVGTPLEYDAFSN